MARGRKQNNTAGNTISRVWFKYFPYWPVFLLFTCIAVAIAWYKVQHLLPYYSASVKIMLTDGNKGGYEDSKIMDELSAGTPKSNVDNQMEVIRSRSLMANVIRNIGIYAMTYEEGRFVDASAYQSSPVVIFAQNPDSIDEVPKASYSFDEKKQLVVLGNRTYPLDQWVKTRYGVLQFQKNKYYLWPAKGPLYFTLWQPNNLAPAFTGSLAVSAPSRSSKIVNVSLMDELPTRAVNILNELMRVFDSASLAEKNRLAKSTLFFVESRLASVKQGLDSIEKQIENYKAFRGGYNVSDQGSMYLSNVGENDKKISDVNLEIDVLNNVKSYVVSKNGTEGGMTPSTLGLTDGTLTQLIKSLNDAQAGYEKMKRTYGENHPSVAPQAAEVSRLRASLLESIDNSKRSLELSRSSLNQSNGRFNSMLQNVPQKEKDLISISREQAIKNNIYNFLLQKREESFLSYSATVGDSRIVESPVPNWTPVSPNPKRTYVMYIIFAFVISIGLIFGKELFNRTVLFRTDIESLTDLPIIGEIAFDKTNKFLITDNKRSFISEQFRKLRASLTYLGISSVKRKKILVTSTIPGEGKSFIAANLGISLAITGKKVILLEFDLVNPSLSNKLYIRESKGLTNYLNGEVMLDDIIKQTNIDDNLFIIPSGPLPDNPTEMILSSKVEALLEILESQFDFILIDTAPVGPMTDAYVLSSHCDATLYVVRHKYTPKVFIERIDEENKINQLKNAAIVFNAVKSRGFSKNSYGYGYGYGYAYNYNYNRDNGKRENGKKENGKKEKSVKKDKAV
jgi:tyrosine-protein kinase Etk/Wzc